MTTSLLLFAASSALAQPAATPYDALVDEYRPYLNVDAPLGFGLKLRAITRDEYRHWRGTKGQFFAWAKTNAGDWLADASDRVPAHGDLHFGNIGVYACGPRVGDVAFGMVDFDDAIELPFQIELLQALVTTRLVARQNAVGVDAAAVDAAMLDAYRAALVSGRTATELLADDPLVAKMIDRARRRPYADEVAMFCDADGRFRRVIGKASNPKEVLEPVDDRRRLDALAAAIGDACVADADLARRLGDVRGRIVGAARRTRLGSSGSQGLEKFLVRLRGPVEGIRGDALIYLKRQIPTAAERAGYVAGDAGDPGTRAARLVDALARPRPIVNAATQVGGQSFLVSLKEPWSAELDADDLKSADDLLHAARIWGTVAGAAHGADGRGTRIAPRVDEGLVALLARRADAYALVQRSAFEALSADRRTIEAVARADAAIAAATK